MSFQTYQQPFEGTEPSLNTVEEFQQIARDTDAAGEWIIYMNHGVDTDQNNDYSIDPDDLVAIMQQAKDLDMWIAPFGTVGAYHRASFALKKASPTKTTEGAKISWELPHPQMPTSIPMKVILDLKEIAGSKPYKIFQKGSEITADMTGAYVIEFANLELDVKF